MVLIIFLSVFFETRRAFTLHVSPVQSGFKKTESWATLKEFTSHPLFEFVLFRKTRQLDGEQFIFTATPDLDFPSRVTINLGTIKVFKKRKEKSKSSLFNKAAFM